MSADEDSKLLEAKPQIQRALRLVKMPRSGLGQRVTNPGACEQPIFVNKTHIFWVQRVKGIRKINSISYCLFDCWPSIFQHDCQEFLALLLNTFHEQLNCGSHDKGTCSTSAIQSGPCDECEKSSEIAHLSMESNFSPSHCTAEAKSNVAAIPNKLSNSCADISQSPTNQVAKSINIDIDSKFPNQAHCSKTFSLVELEKNMRKDTIMRTEKNEIASRDNISPNRYALLEDFVKDTKTLNTNVLINECTNNELAFDSRKFPKLDRSRLRGAVDNLHSLPVNFVENSIKSRKVKETNLLAETKLKKSHLENRGDDPIHSTLVNACIKRMRLDESTDNLLNCKKIKTVSDFTNDELELANCSDDDDDDVTNDSSDQSDEEITVEEPPHESDACRDDRDLVGLAEREWRKYLDQNKSVIVSTFLGQFKSTVSTRIYDDFRPGDTGNVSWYVSGRMLRVQSFVGYVRAIHVLTDTSAARTGKTIQ